jgi:hypothetical protein
MHSLFLLFRLLLALVFMLLGLISLGFFSLSLLNLSFSLVTRGSFQPVYSSFLIGWPNGLGWAILAAFCLPVGRKLYEYSKQKGGQSET